MPGMKSSPLRNSLTWFKHGCCVPSNTVLWLIIVLFIFTIFLFVCCCLTITFTRWMHVRTIRNKCDLLKLKYKEEGRSRKEMDLRMKEFAMRPIHTHHFHQNGRPRKHRPPAPAPPPVIDAPPPPPNLNLPVEAPPAGLPGLFTGFTPLSSADGVDQKQSKEPSPDTKTGSSAPLAFSSTPSAPGTSGTTIVEEVAMERRDVAATAHAIASSKVPITHQVPFPGVLLVKKDKEKSSAEWPSIASSESKTATTGSSRDKGVPGKLGRDTAPLQRLSSESDGLKRPSKTGTGRSRGTNGVPKRMRTTPSLPVGSRTTTSKPSSQSFFPYWTGRRRMCSVVGPNTTSTGTTRGSKMVSTEKSTWGPTGGTSSSSKPSSKPRTPSTKRPPEPPADVYELRRRMERARENQRACGAVMEEPSRGQGTSTQSPFVHDITSRSSAGTEPPAPYQHLRDRIEKDRTRDGRGSGVIRF
uniref:Uncharacterized protein n=1 Tax=Haemonchus contortus TaxID=6289 RepID=A0A7I4YA47_HAECO